MRKRRYGYKFTEKKHSKCGIASFVLAIMLLLLFFVFVYWSYKSNGNLSLYYGSIGVMAMLVSFISFVMSLFSLKEEDVFLIFPKLGAGTSMLALFCWLGTYIMGFLKG